MSDQLKNDIYTVARAMLGSRLYGNIDPAAVCLYTTTEFAHVAMSILSQSDLDVLCKDYADHEKRYRDKYKLIGPRPHETGVLWNINEWVRDTTLFDYDDRNGSLWRTFKQEFPDGSDDHGRLLGIFEAVLERLESDGAFSTFGSRSNFVVFPGFVGDPEIDYDVLFGPAVRLNKDKIDDVKMHNLRTYFMEDSQ